MSKTNISTSDLPTADLIKDIQEFLKTAGRGEAESESDLPVGRGVGVRYYVDPAAPEVFFDPGTAGGAQLKEKYSNPAVARKQILAAGRKFIERAGRLNGAPREASAETAELFWLVRLRTESPYFRGCLPAAVRTGRETLPEAAGSRTPYRRRSTCCGISA